MFELDYITQANISGTVTDAEVSIWQFVCDMIKEGCYVSILRVPGIGRQMKI